MKILYLDIETSPNLAHVWGIWQQNIGINQIMDSSYVLCWSAKWAGSKDIIFDSVHNNIPEEMLKSIHKLLDEADAVVHFNGTKFDIPTLNKEFLIYGMTPPSPYKQIDLLRVARNQFKFPSNKLNYITQALGIGKKTEHVGHELWIGCMNHEGRAWKTMEKYNKNDVVLLEELYKRLKPWIRGHANYNLYTDVGLVCPNCGSEKHHKRGVYYTNLSSYQRHVCTKCGTWFRSNKAGSKGIYAN